MAHSSTPRTFLVGLGETGLSVARHLHRRGEEFSVWDEEPSSEALQRLRAEWPEAPVHSGVFDTEAFRHASTVIVSPGIPFDHPALRAAGSAGAQVCGDIELFARVANAPVLGITGSNGKSTTTRLVCHLLERMGAEVRCGGNLGPPALSLLRDEAPDAYVLELSSFQLESTHVLPCRAGVILNLTPDHLDRHGSLEHYREIKLRLYRDAEVAVYNRDDPHTRPSDPCAQTGFGLDEPPGEEDFGIRRRDGENWFCQGSRWLGACRELPLPGRHNRANGLAALALLWAYGADPKEAAGHLSGFPGLAHRLCLVAEIDGVRWYDDSKATNFDALAAALASFEEPCVLLAGGRAKDDDPARVRDIVFRRTRAVVLFGEDGPDLARAWTGAKTRVVPSMAEAVEEARALAHAGDRVLLSPGCTSFDQYGNYRERGADFLRCIEEENRS